MYPDAKTELFEENVKLKYQLFNSIFITLPFSTIDNTGTLLPLFNEMCHEGYGKNKSPQEIFDTFSATYLAGSSEKEKIDIMFRFIQYVERQVVLFDAIEDAAFTQLNNLGGHGSLEETRDRAESSSLATELQGFLQNFRIRTVLTAHPTQFYPGSVLGIITDLTAAIKENNLGEIKTLLSQLGKTSFIKKKKPTPFDEAISLLWYLENVFYNVSGAISGYIQQYIYNNGTPQQPVLSLGFWPGGDRDGNPYVTSEITARVASRLRTSILKCYYNDIRRLKRKLTFEGVEILVAGLEHKLYRSVFYSEGEIYISLPELKQSLYEIRQLIINKHQSLYLDEVNELINKVNLFGFYFASLDIRQNSSIHTSVFGRIMEKIAKSDYRHKGYNNMSEANKIIHLDTLHHVVNPDDFDDEEVRSTLSSIAVMRQVQENNGEEGCNRYIVSNTGSALDILQLLAMLKMTGWENPPVDLIPLFETVEDLKESAAIMQKLYTNKKYSLHLEQRGNRQTIMLGFSDGTKDGGYLMANWSIYKAKEQLTALSRQYGIKVLFFDGRGGPPARGGGKTHKFYASQGPTIENNEIQITIQGQTISSNFGTPDTCRFNLENLLSAGITNGVFNKNKEQLTLRQRQLLERLAVLSYQKYTDFKNHPKFVPYLEKMSTLNYYARTNIGSRPAKRGVSKQLDFNDLRAIPFVGSWSQLKQNVPGFFGFGHALATFEKEDRWEEVKALYDESLFFRTLAENSMMSLSKSFFPLTAYMKDDEEFGSFWDLIFNEYKETRRLLLKLSGYTELMQNYPDGYASIKMREHIVLPLLTIQQYALHKIRLIRKCSYNDELLEVYEKIVIRSLFGNINASRNSA
ncbi:phosphoenolpyruvate carboxylase [Flavobacterium cyanobacteriorum]|uniref:Phosphoenolpyruvate carboxylase n=1 Tax=Flavobacterium cyanobacteriorum TaxID=2022802 RepID=A0A255Z824_9FLAO|nr:phosphoenolpyruvate carboxylase [Flavobacterium cyanobacteriorum]OYQ36780.1 phosphoenolpyruvate carboxylase [Flavobacterium cyanobacteriorum]